MNNKTLLLLISLSINNLIIKPIDFWNKKSIKTVTTNIDKIDANIISINAIYGNINIKGYNGNKIEIKATINDLEKNLTDVSLEHKYDEKAKNINIFTKNKNPNNSTKINYEINIPTNMKLLEELKIEIEKGNINIKDFGKAINITGNNSDITIEGSKKRVTITLKTGSVKLKTQHLKTPDNIFINIESYGIVELDLAKHISTSLKLQTHNGKITSLCPVTLYPPVYLKELNAKEWNNLKKDLSLAVGDIEDESKLATVIAQINSGNILVKQY